MLASNTFGCLLDGLFAKWMPYFICNTYEKLFKFNNYYTVFQRITNVDTIFPNPGLHSTTLSSTTHLILFNINSFSITKLKHKFTENPRKMYAWIFPPLNLTITGCPVVCHTLESHSLSVFILMNCVSPLEPIMTPSCSHRTIRSMSSPMWYLRYLTSDNGKKSIVN